MLGNAQSERAKSGPIAETPPTLFQPAINAQLPIISDAKFGEAAFFFDLMRIRQTFPDFGGKTRIEIG